MRTVTAAWAWTGAELIRWPNIRVAEDGRVLALASGAEDGATGILLPGLINAHAHLELSGLRGQVPGDGDMLAWVQRLFGLRQGPDAAAMRAAIAELSASGTAAVLDVSNTGAPFPHLVEAAAAPTGWLRARLQLELLAFTDAGFEEGRRRQQALPQDAGVTSVLTPHSVHALSEGVLRRWAAERRPGEPTPTLHCDECPADRELIAQGTGPWAALLDRWERPWRGALASGRSEVDALQRLGLLGPDLGLVHLLAADAADLDLIAAAGAPVVLCPRSNLHIHGRLPDAAAMVRRGIPLALGTDSLASNADLDLLAEAATLRAAASAIDPSVWLRALTLGGAALFGDPELGVLRPGARPGLLLVHIPPTDDPIATLLDGTRWPRSWLA